MTMLTPTAFAHFAQHIFDAPWEDTTAAFWRKYPHPGMPHVKEALVLRRAVDAKARPSLFVFPHRIYYHQRVVVSTTLMSIPLAPSSPVLARGPDYPDTSTRESFYFLSP